LTWWLLQNTSTKLLEQSGAMVAEAARLILACVLNGCLSLQALQLGMTGIRDAMQSSFLKLQMASTCK
jgi:hypothetical protein